MSMISGSFGVGFVKILHLLPLNMPFDFNCRGGVSEHWI